MAIIDHPTPPTNHFLIAAQRDLRKNTPEKTHNLDLLAR
jgi:hypothetical protein